MPARIRPVSFVLCSVLVFTLSAAGGAYAQGRTVNPPIVRIELSGQEPLAAEAAQITFITRYGAAATQPAPVATSSAVRWAISPPNPDYPGPETLFRACGYARPPLGALTTPSGARPVPASDGDSACWNYRIEWVYGMPLGAFTFTLTGPEGALTHTWEIVYPSRPVTTHLRRDAESAQPAAACPNSPPPRLQARQNARVTPGDPNNIRAAPESGRVIGSIPAGGQFRVLEGPVCGPRRGLTWWRVSYQGIEGWTAEGQGGVYWLEPVR